MYKVTLVICTQTGRLWEVIFLGQRNISQHELDLESLSLQAQGDTRYTHTCIMRKTYKHTTITLAYVHISNYKSSFPNNHMPLSCSIVFFFSFQIPCFHLSKGRSLWLPSTFHLHFIIPLSICLHRPKAMNYIIKLQTLKRYILNQCIISTTSDYFFHVIIPSFSCNNSWHYIEILIA